MSNSLIKKNPCNDTSFDKLLLIPEVTADENLKSNIKEIQILYNNGNFYLSAGEFSGALVSYACAAVLLNSTGRSLPPTISGESDIDPKEFISNMQNCCLNAVEYLQSKVKSSSKKDDTEDDEKDWDKICTRIQPLVFSKGSSDCIFYNDVAGMLKEKKLIDSSLVYPLIYPNLYPKASKGILIYGPPGTGKTYLVKAAVNELQKKDPNVGVLYFAPSPGDLKGKYVGETEKRIEEIFTCASKAACKYETEYCTNKKYISIIFMDEMDAIGPDRNTDTTGLAANSVNTLLQMMDGIKSAPNVAVVAATNYPWNLDGAILRRFDTQIFVNVPEAKDLLQLLNLSMSKILTLEDDKTQFSYCQQEKIKEGKAKDQGKKQGANPICELECDNKIPEEKYLIAPYNQFSIDYYENNKGKGSIIDALVSYMKVRNFSNSDLNRFIKAAATNSGEVALTSNLFYSTKYLNNFTSDKYISCLTKMKDVLKSIKTSIDILKAFDKNDVNGLGTIYQAKKPDFVYIVGPDNYRYYNTKCLFYKKSEINLDTQKLPIKDIYIKLCEDKTSGLDDASLNTINKEYSDLTNLEVLYLENILCVQGGANLMFSTSLGNKRTLKKTINVKQKETPELKKMEDDLKTQEVKIAKLDANQNRNIEQEKQLTEAKNKRDNLIKAMGKEKEVSNTASTDKISDIIISFDFAFKQTNKTDTIDSYFSVPKLKLLTQCVFIPTYNLFKDVQKQIITLNGGYYDEATKIFKYGTSKIGQQWALGMYSLDSGNVDAIIAQEDGKPYSYNLLNIQTAKLTGSSQRFVAKVVKEKNLVSKAAAKLVTKKLKADKARKDADAAQANLEPDESEFFDAQEGQAGGGENDFISYAKFMPNIINSDKCEKLISDAINKTNEFSQLQNHNYSLYCYLVLYYLLNTSTYKDLKQAIDPEYIFTTTKTKLGIPDKTPKKELLLKKLLVNSVFIDNYLTILGDISGFATIKPYYTDVNSESKIFMPAYIDLQKNFSMLNVGDYTFSYIEKDKKVIMPLYVYFQIINDSYLSKDLDFKLVKDQREQIIGPLQKNTNKKAINENYYVELDASFFRIIFQEYLDFRGVSMVVRDVNNQTDFVTCQSKIVQMYIDEILKVYKIQKEIESMYPQQAQAATTTQNFAKDLNSALTAQQNLIDLFATQFGFLEKGSLFELSSLVLDKIFKNYLWQMTNNAPSITKTLDISETNDEDVVKDVKTKYTEANTQDNEGPEIEDIDGGGYKNKTMKKYKNNKNGTLRKKSKFYNSNIKEKTRSKHFESNIIQTGGAVQIEELFVEFCVSETTPKQTISSAKKTMFINTQFNYTEVRREIRKNIFSQIYNYASSFVEIAGDTFSENFSSEAKNEERRMAKEAARMEASNKALEELNKGNVLLAKIFKTYKSMGFITTDENGTTDDDVIIKNLSSNENPKILWSEKQGSFGAVYNTLTTIVTSLIQIQEAMGKDTTLGSFSDVLKVCCAKTIAVVGVTLAAAGAIAGIILTGGWLLGYGAAAYGLVAGAAGAVGGAAGVVGGLGISVVQNIGLTAGVFAALAPTATATVVTGLQVWASVVGLSNIYSFLIPGKSAEAITGDVLITKIMRLASENQYVETELPLSNFDPLYLVSHDIIKSFEQMTNSEVFLNVVSGINNPGVQGMWVGIPYTKYYKELGNAYQSIKSKNKTQPSNSKPIRRYSETIKEDPEIKKKLVNLNIPLSSFYYAQTVVQSTYDSTTAKDLVAYNQNRDEFMKKYYEKKRK
jgi:SpoVK/Ycf46/Vps4 family AAA+-type ATPase